MGAVLISADRLAEIIKALVVFAVMRTRLKRFSNSVFVKSLPRFCNYFRTAVIGTIDSQQYLATFFP